MAKVFMEKYLILCSCLILIEYVYKQNAARCCAVLHCIFSYCSLPYAFCLAAMRSRD